MAQTEQSQAVDLFGNPTLTPRQLMQQQLARIMQSTAQETAGADPRTRGVSKMGAAAGGLLGKVLIEKGVLPKPPEMVRAERLAAAREAIQKDAAEKGLSPESNPTDFANMAVSHFLRAGDEQAAMMAINWRNLQEANKRAAELERATIEHTKADTALKGRTPGTGTRSPFFEDVDLADGSKASFNARTGEYLDPVTKQPITDPERLRGARFSADLQRQIAAGKKAGEKAGEETVMIDGKLDAMEAVGSARDMLDAGIYTGTFAEVQLAVSKALPGDKKKAENTERFLAYVGNTVVPRLQEFGGNDSVEELKYLNKVMAGDIKMEEGALRKILEAAERKIRRGIKRARKRAKDAGLPAEGEEVAEKPAAKKPAAPELPAGWKVKTK